MAQTVCVIVSAEERVRLAAIVFLLRTGLMLRVQRPTAKKGTDIEVVTFPQKSGHRVMLFSGLPDLG